MKKRLLFILFAFVYLNVNSQVLSFRTDAVKEYDDNTRTSYITLDGVISSDIIPVIEKEILVNQDVKHFSFYDNTNRSKCMFTSVSSVDGKQIVDMINDIISENIREDKNTQPVDIINDEVFKFNLEGIKDEMHKKQIVEILLRYGWVISADINVDNVCKLVLKKGTEMPEIEKVFENLGLKISLITNR